MTYERVKILIALTLALYCFIGLSLRGSGREDLYPIFSWSLFSGVPNPRVVDMMEVSRFGSDVYDPPLPFAQTKDIFQKLGSSPTEYTPRIRELADAIRENDAGRISAMRREVEVMFNGEEFEYSILQAFVDPIEYWKYGTYRTLDVLGTFASGNL